MDTLTDSGTLVTTPTRTCIFADCYMELSKISIPFAAVFVLAPVGTLSRARDVGNRQMSQTAACEEAP